MSDVATIESTDGRCIICLCSVDGSHGTGDGHVDFCYGCNIDCGAIHSAGLRLLGWLHQTATDGPPNKGQHKSRRWARNEVGPKRCDDCFVVLIPSERESS